jgi:hypothetical protein
MKHNIISVVIARYKILCEFSKEGEIIQYENKGRNEKDNSFRKISTERIFTL